MKNSPSIPFYRKSPLPFALTAGLAGFFLGRVDQSDGSGEASPADLAELSITADETRGQISKLTLPCLASDRRDCDSRPSFVCFNASDEINPVIQNIRPEVVIMGEHSSFLDGSHCEIADPQEMEILSRQEWDHSGGGLFPAEFIIDNQWPADSDGVYVCTFPNGSQKIAGFKGELPNGFDYDFEDADRPHLVAFSKHPGAEPVKIYHHAEGGAAPVEISRKELEAMGD